MEFWCSARSLHLLEQLDAMAKVLELKGYISVKEGPSVRHMIEDKQEKLKQLQEAADTGNDPAILTGKVEAIMGTSDD